MHETIQKMAQAFAKRREQHRKACALFTAMAILVSLSTAYLLVQPANTMAADYYCGMVEHEHDKDCYEKVLICEMEGVDPVGGAGSSGGGLDSSEEIPDEPTEENPEVEEPSEETSEEVAGEEPETPAEEPQEEPSVPEQGALEAPEQTPTELPAEEPVVKEETPSAPAVQPEVQEPVVEAPVIQEAPVVSEPASEPVVEAPVESEPAAEEPASESMSVQTLEMAYVQYSNSSDAESPASEPAPAPSAPEAPVVEAPVVQEAPVVSEPAPEPVIETPVESEPVAEETPSAPAEDSAEESTEPSEEEVESVESSEDASEPSVSGGHVHSGACYEYKLICDLEEHQHEEACMSLMLLLPEGAEIPEGYDYAYPCLTDDYSVVVYAPEGAIPEGAILNVEVLEEGSDEYIAAGEALDAMLAGETLVVPDDDAVVEETPIIEDVADETEVAEPEVTDPEPVEEPVVEETAESVEESVEEDPVEEEPAVEVAENEDASEQTLEMSLVQYSNGPEEDVAEEEKSYDGYKALDIRFELDGKEVEPLAPVYVVINAAGLLPPEADPESVAIQHHAEMKAETFVEKVQEIFGTKEIVVDPVADVADETPGVVEVSESAYVAEQDLTAAFEVASFSSFTITWKEAGEKTLTICYVDVGGNDIPGTQMQDVYVAAKSVVDLADYAGNIPGFNFIGVKFDDVKDTYAEETTISYVELSDDGTIAYLVYQRTSETTTNGYDENLADCYLSSDPKANAWQIVSGEYGTVSYQYDNLDDPNVRIRKEVMSTGVENEFYIYLEVGAKTSWNDILTGAGRAIITTKNYEGGNKKATTLLTEKITELRQVDGNKGYVYFDPDDAAANGATLQYELYLEIYEDAADYGGTPIRTLHRTCYGTTSNCENGSFFLYVPDLEKTIRCSPINLQSDENKGGTYKLTVPIFESALGGSDFDFSETVVSVETLTDVMGQVGTTVTTSCINYEGLVTCDGTFRVTGSNGEWSFEDAAGKIEVITDTENQKLKWTTYRLLYKITLDVEAPGFVSCADNQNDPYENESQPISPADSIYETNAETRLTFTTTTTTNGEGTTSNPLYLSAVSPQVQGLLYNYYLNKVDGNTKQPLDDAIFTMTNEYGKEYTATSGENNTDTKGLVSFIGLPWGTYTLKETVAPDGYQNPTFTEGGITLCYTTDSSVLTEDGTMMKRDEALITVENLLNNGNLAISKTVEVNGTTNNTGTFTFNVTGIPAGTYTTSAGDMTFDGTDTVAIEAGSTLTIRGIPAGTTVTVEETGYDGYAPSWKVDNGSVTNGDTAQTTVDSGATVTIYFTNTTGAVLPSTGGIGTNFFTTMGIVMMLVAGVLLLDQRRRLVVSKADPQ